MKVGTQQRPVELDLLRTAITTALSKSPTPYQYSSLEEEKEIRILTLLPGKRESCIRVYLQNVPLIDESLLLFEALSYTWGSQEDLKDIVIGESGNRTLAITRNLAEALRDLRYVDEPRTLWIDAICVNQQDLDERSSQVKMMSQIYSKAARVVVWLGPPSSDSSIAFDCLEMMSSRISVDWSTKTIAALTEESHWSNRDNQPPFDKPQILAICNLFNRHWFGRLWIWQEIQLPQNPFVMCGSRMIPWKAISDMVFWIYTKTIPPLQEESLSHERLLLIYYLCKGQLHNRFSNLMDESKHCGCTDPRDRVFAVLSLLTGVEKDIDIEPDYTKSTYEVYEDAVVKLISRVGNLRILQTVEMYNHPEGVPSWVPDWSKPRITRPLTYCSASANLGSIVAFPKPGILQVSGVKVTTISLVEAFNLSDLAYNSIILDLQKVVSRAGFPGPFPQGSEDLKNLCRVFSCNVFAEKFYPNDPNLISLENCQEVLRACLTIQPGSDDKSDPLSRDTRRFSNSVYRFCRGRALFRCEQGRVGLAPRGARPGDVVCALLGCDTASILRPISQNQFCIVGEAFCTGIMTGEAILGPLPDSFDEPVRSWEEPFPFRHLLHLDSSTGIMTKDDPRLGCLPPGWRLVHHDEEKIWSKFEHDETGESTKLDPRITPEFFKERGVHLRKFDLA